MSTKNHPRSGPRKPNSSDHKPSGSRDGKLAATFRLAFASRHNGTDFLRDSIRVLSNDISMTTQIGLLSAVAEIENAWDRAANDPAASVSNSVCHTMGTMAVQDYADGAFDDDHPWRSVYDLGVLLARLREHDPHDVEGADVDRLRNQFRSLPAELLKSTQWLKRAGGRGLKGNTVREFAEELLKLSPDADLPPLTYNPAKSLLIKLADAIHRDLERVPAPNISDGKALADVRLSPAKRKIMSVIRKVGHRLTTTQILNELSSQGEVVSIGTTKNYLSGLVDAGLLTNRQDVVPRGYGLPEWD